jgi:hypothetical protein
MTAHGPGEMRHVPKPLSSARALSGRSPDEDLDGPVRVTIESDEAQPSAT